MSSLILSLIAMALTTILLAYALALSYQLAVLTSDGIRSRSFPGAERLAPFWQNVGLTVALFGFLQMELTMIVFGVLLIALRLVILPVRAAAWDEQFEPLLLGMALVFLAILGAIHLGSRFLN